MNKILKPIFHCATKPLALGTFASPNAKDSTFALPNAKQTNMLVSLVLGDAIFFLRYLTQNPQRESVEYRLHWVPNAERLRWPCTFHVFCVDFISVWCQRKPSFQWNMCFINCIHNYLDPQLTFNITSEVIIGYHNCYYSI